MEVGQRRTIHNKLSPSDDPTLQDDDDDDMPIYGSRLACAKMFAELGSFDEALEVVETLLIEVLGFVW
jgi:hypothetical protein